MNDQPVCNRVGSGHAFGSRHCAECRCRCGRIKIGLKTTDNKNWDPDCSEHGVNSDWYADHPWGGA